AISAPFQRTVFPAHGRPSCVMRTTAVPERSAEAAVSVAAFLIAAPAFSTPGPPPGDATVRATTTAAAAASITPAAERRTTRRRRVGVTTSSGGSEMCARTDATTSAKPVRLRGLARRSAWKLADVLMILLRFGADETRWAFASRALSRRRLGSVDALDGGVR